MPNFKIAYPENMRLTIDIIEKAQPGVRPHSGETGRPYKMSDGGGLFLLVTPKGGKWWRIKYRYAGRENQLSLGVYPKVSLDEARARRQALRALLAQGIDPSAYLKAERAAQRAEAARHLAAMRFTLDNTGALTFCLGSRRLTLTPAETQELRTFLDATGAVATGGAACR